MANRIQYVALLLLVVLLTGCGRVTATPTTAPTESILTTPVSPLSPLPTPEAPSILPSPTASPLAIPPGTALPPASERARAELATRLGVDPDSIEVVSITRQEMPIQFLGCPPEGTTPRADMPAMVMGEEIVLRHDGVEHVYHAHLVKLLYCGQR